MNSQEYEKFAPGLQRVKQALGQEYSELELDVDKQKLLHEALTHIGELMDINLEPSSGDLGQDLDLAMERLSNYTGIRIQKINLDLQWWNDDLGIILGFIKDKPCVLTPKNQGGYNLSSLAGKVSLTPQQLSEISPFGYTFTKPLPDKVNTLYDLAKFSFKPLLSKLKSIVILQLGLSLILMSLPILMSYLFDNFGDFIQTEQSGILGTALIVNSLVFFLLSLFQSLVLLHLRFKVQMRLEPAIWDRLLKLPPDFFHQFNSGDIAYRANAVSSVQELLAQSSLLSVFSFVTVFVSFGLMCFYDLFLALLVLAASLIIAPTLFLINYRVLIYQRKINDYLTKQSGFVFQVIRGIMKFKVSATEYRAFALWSDYFSNLLIARYKSERLKIYLNLISGVLLMFMTLLLFSVYIYFDPNLNFGSFIAFNAAFSQFFTALLAISTFLSSVMTIIPFLEQSMVICTTKPEPLQRGGSQMKIEGKLTIKNLSFRYDESQPLIYKNISLEINPGEVIGITGSSGCGKTTLFRILLGLEKPLDGQIFFDDTNMDIINIANLRQQIGVVSQKSVLTPGTILDNIIGNDKHLTRNDAWDIAFKLGIDKMIEGFPMAMDTFINEGMQSLSGGEQQRIVLARALIKKPKILLLDEATSALDAQNQANIQGYLAQLNITQIIIAHRLSTLKEATRILVIQDGRIIEDGNFEELVKKDGHFAALAKFQFGQI